MLVPMQGSRRPRRPLPETEEAGYILIGVIFMVALMVLSLAIAAPRIAASIQRDRELEVVHRGEQYKRAIRLYYKKFGSYPSSIDQLEKTNNIRFLRKRYTDPLTGKDDWKLILMGQAHVRPLGFFGQQMGVGAPLAGASPIGGGIGGSIGSSMGSSSGGSSMNGAGFGSSSLGSTASTGMAGSVGTTGSGASGGLYAPATTDDGSGSSTSGASTSTSLGSGTASSTTLGGSSTGASGNGLGASTSTTLGGAPIVGVMPPLTKASILFYKLKTNYKEWEFVYDPVEEQTAAGSILGGGGNINGTGNSVNGPGSSTSSSFGSGNTGSGSSSFGGSSGSSFGSTGTGSTGQSPTTTP